MVYRKAKREGQAYHLFELNCWRVYPSPCAFARGISMVRVEEEGIRIVNSRRSLVPGMKQLDR